MNVLRPEVRLVGVNALHGEVGSARVSALCCEAQEIRVNTSNVEVRSG